MARHPRKEGAQSKKRGNRGASGRRSAPKHPQKRARKSEAKAAKTTKSNRRASVDAATLKRELNEARTRQAATAEILKIIAGSPSDVKPVFDAIVKSAVDLCGARFGAVFRMEGDLLHLVADRNFGPIQRQLLGAMYPMVPNRGHISGRAILDRAVVQIPDIYADAHYKSVEAKKAGFRSLLATPLLQGNRAIGSIVIYRTEPGAFTESQSTLLQSFAAQAVIAIENTRLFNETNEALAQQTATSEVLEVISSSTGDVQPVFKSMLNNALRICEAKFGQLLLFDGRGLLPAELHNTPAEYAELFKRGPLVPGPKTGLGRLIAGKKVIHIPDVTSGSLYAERDPLRIATVDILKARTLLAVPMLQDARLVGAIVIYRQEARPFSDRQIKLVTNFASQAVIAIENARLFNETREALERQTATSEILKVIASSPDDVRPVFDAIAQSARRVIGGHSALVTRVVGQHLHIAAFTAGSEAGREKLTSAYPQPLSSQVMSAQVARTGRVVTYADTERDADNLTREFARVRGYRSVLAVPMLRDGATIGTINVTRVEPGAFDDNTIGLLKTFADQAVIAIENARLFNETREALARQTATSEVLQVISSSPGDLKPVFGQMLAKAMRLCEAQCGFIYQMEQGAMRAVAEIGVPPAFAEYRRHNLHTGGATTPADIMRATKKPAHVHDARDSDAYRQGNPNAVAGVELGGARTVLYVPMLRNDDIVGVINLYRLEVKPFTDQQIALLENFASQAVIAIENARLFNETKEALERQTATADILKVIASSPDDVQPVFQAIAEASHRLVGGFSSSVLSIADETVHLSAFTQTTAGGDSALASLFPRPLSRVLWGAAARRGEVFQIVDSEVDMITEPSREMARLRGWRSALYVPLMRDEKAVGAIAVSRAEPGAFSDHHVQLLKTFADQAVIAIENARLFNETKEALARQTATADVLKVIASSPSNLQPVFDAIAARSNELMAGHSTTVFRFNGDIVELAAATSVGKEADAMLRAAFPRPRSAMQRVEPIFRGEIVEAVDATAGTEPEISRSIALARGFRSRLDVPLTSENGTIGFISITRKEPGKFAEKDVELLQTFADQAVIAIQNVELFEEVQARTRDLQESLQQQTVTADVLKVISRSAFDLQTVLDTLVESATQLCEAEEGIILQPKGEGFSLVADFGLPPEKREFLGKTIFRPKDGRLTGRVLAEGKVVHIDDVLGDPDFIVEGDPDPARTRLGVPLLRDGTPAGVFVLTRREVRPFTDRQIELVQTFADQAVIAISNAELFRQVENRTKELSESLEQQTATSEVLEVISGSAGELEPVFQKMLENATRVCGANFGTMSLYDAGSYQNVALYNVPDSSTEQLLAPIRPHPNSGLATVARTLQAVQIEDLRTQPPYLEGHPAALAISDLAGARTLVIVPMLRENELIGTIAIYRQEVRRFTDKQVDLVANFAKQAVIAIENTRLLSELRERTRELSRSLDDLRAAQDRLVQTEKLASLGQLTAGIAHEIKNPLNFVNNFSALSVELTDELNDVLKQAELAEKVELEVGELTQLLKSNLEKVVQHGKRADSIVKNMLLHSREGSGEQRAADINTLVEESLNLAYHGARAEKSGFNITLQRAFDAGAGSAVLYPQEMTRALLNLISNGFYAASKRKAENGEAAFEPTLLATTKNLGHAVEIRIRDNGAGIPPEVREKMFNPFFTTKPAGEGTGLGLSMTHDIIVKQHGGTIDVATEPGKFTEFIIVLPRANEVHGKSQGPA